MERSKRVKHSLRSSRIFNGLKASDINFLTMSVKNAIVFFVFLLAVASGYAQVQLSNTDLIKLDLDVLAKKRKRLNANDASLQPAYRQLLKTADKLLQYGPVSVMDKTVLPPSGDKHDYMSLAPYWWPDSSKADGLPYIRKDGVTNPEVKNYPDKNNMPKLCENVYLLALAYYYSGQQQYAAHAAKLLKVWFLDTATRMNPNLNYGQAIKGRNDGRGAGIIDTRQFIFAIDAVTLIQKSKSWRRADMAGMKQWFAAYLQWLNTSVNGRDEMDAPNNHGVWFDAQSLAMALFVDSTAMAKKIIKRAAERLDTQMDSNGYFPLEMERTTSLHYSVFILNAFNIIAVLSEQAKVDFWGMETKSGKSLRKALQVMVPYLSGEKPWTGPQIKDFHYQDAFQLLIRGAGKLQCSSCLAAIQKIAGIKQEGLLVNLL
jgi:hypothetical protein